MSAPWLDYVLNMNGGYHAVLRGPRRDTHAEATVDREETAALVGDAPALSFLLVTLDRLGVPEGRLSVRLSWLATALEPGGVLREQLAEALVDERDRARADLAAARAANIGLHTAIAEALDLAKAPAGATVLHRIAGLGDQRNRAVADLAETQARAAAREAELLARIEALQGMADTLAAAEEDATRRPSLRRFLRRLLTPARVR